MAPLPSNQLDQKNWIAQAQKLNAKTKKQQNPQQRQTTEKEAILQL